MAIVFDNTTQADTNTSSYPLSFSHTTSGSDRILFVYLYWNNSRTVSGITYNGTSMTAVSTANNNGGGEYSNMYYLAAPDTGANTISITMSGACSIEAVASSYTGAAQTSPIDAFRYEPANLETGTSYSEALTTSDDNCWVVWGTREYAGRTISSGTNTAFREKVNVIFGAILADSNAAVSPAGSRTLNLTANASANWYSDVLVSFKPAASAAAGGTARRLFMMGM